MDARARRVLAVRLQAEARGDGSLVAECDAQLSRWGIDLTAGAPEHVLPPPAEKRPAKKR